MKMMSANYLAGIFGFLIYISIANAAIPSYIKVCQRSDPNLAACINNSINIIRPTLLKGIPELEVPRIDPLVLDRIELRTGPTSAKINANITNLKVFGPSSFVIDELIPKINKYQFRFKVSLPFLHFEGDYELDMKILLIELRGKGAIRGNMTDYKFECLMKGRKVQRDGQEYLEFGKMKLLIGIGKPEIVLDNLFNGDPVLGRAANEVIADNADLFISEIRPALQEALAEKFTTIANKITLRFTTQELFP